MLCAGGAGLVGVRHPWRRTRKVHSALMKISVESGGNTTRAEAGCP